MSKQPTLKLYRLLAIETAKVKALEAEREKYFQAYCDCLSRAVVAETRLQQAMAILQGEACE